MREYITTDGDMLDEICARHYAGDTAMLAAVLEANAHLGERDPVLPSGLRIVLPPARPLVLQVERLWN